MFLQEIKHPENHTNGTFHRNSGTYLLISVLILLFWHMPLAHAQHGDLDPTFLTGTGANGTVHSVIETNAGKILITGAFSSYDGVTRNGVALLNADGNLDTSFDPGIGVNGTVYQAISAPFGRFLLVGNFSSYDGNPVGNLVLINADGSVQANIQPGSGTDGPIHAVAQVGGYYGPGDGWLIGGDFSSVSGQAQENFARITFSGAPVYSHPVDGIVRSIQMEQGNDENRFVICGDFTSVVGSTGFSGIAKIDFEFGQFGYVDNYFRPQTTGGAVRTAVLAESYFSSDQYTMIAGDFTHIGDFSQAYLGIVDRDGEPDPFFSIHPNGAVHAVSLDSTENVAIIAGAFTEVNGIPMRGIARISLKDFYHQNYGSVERWELDQNFGGAEGPDDIVHAVLEDSQGRYLAGGEFTEVDTTERNGIARLLSRFGLSLPEAPTGLAAEPLSDEAIRLTWNPSANAGTYDLELSADGISGWTRIRSTSSTSHIESGFTPETEYHFRVRAVNSNGVSAYSPTAIASTTETWSGPGSFVAGTAGVSLTSSSIYDTAVQPDGKILITGFFTNILGFERKYIARLNADRTLDTGFDPGNLLDSRAELVAVAPDGKIYVVSNSFSSTLGLDDYEILRLNPDGSLDSSFIPPKSSYDIECIDADSSGNVLIGLSTETFGGQNTGALVRLRSNGTIDESFSIHVDSWVYAISIHPDRRIVAGGSLYDVNGVPKRNIMRCDASGNIDPAIGNSEYISTVRAVKALSDGSIIIAGSFTSVYGESRSHIAKLNPNGTLNASFTPPEINSTVSHIESLYDGKLLIAGSFTTVDGKYMPRLACLDSSGASVQDFRIGVGPSSTVNSIAMAHDGSLIVAGSFSSFDSESSGRIVFLNAYPPSSAPIAPTAEISDAGDGFLDVSWADQGSEFSYTIEVSNTGFDGWSELASLSRDFTNYAITDLPPGSTRFFRVRATNALGTSDYSDVVSATTWTRFQIWNVENGFAFNTAADADEDGDDMSQLMEYGLDLNPNISDADGAISSQMIGGNLVLTYFRSRSELVYQVELSQDLDQWTTEGVSVYHGNFSMGWAPVVGPQKFLRLAISQP